LEKLIATININIIKYRFRRILKELLISVYYRKQFSSRPEERLYSSIRSTSTYAVLMA